jgi:hypothetical protein
MRKFRQYFVSISKSRVLMERATYTFSSALLVSKITSPFSKTPQPIATAAQNLVSYRVATVKIPKLLNLPARCFKGTPAKARAAHDALIAHGRS